MEGLKRGTGPGTGQKGNYFSHQRTKQNKTISEIRIPTDTLLNRPCPPVVVLQDVDPRSERLCTVENTLGTDLPTDPFSPVMYE